jgi:hypothetical protein
MSKPMSKPLLYGIFIVKFLFGLALIWWTIWMTLSSDVGEDEDNAFLSTYHNVDDNFNNMITQNNSFEQRYNLKFYLNDELIEGLTLQDVFLAQRAINQRKIRKDILKVGENKFSYTLTTKENGKKLNNVNLSMLVTMATTHQYDKKLEFENTNLETFNINKQGYWNITGTIEVNDHKGYFFIKTNAR